jgi:ClpP class serine protease
MAWLLKPEVARAMQEGRALGYQPTLEERARFAAAMREAYAGRDAEAPRNMQVSGNVAMIAIEGVLTEKPDCFAMLFGGGNTTYESIRRGIALAESNPDVQRTELHIASPGGHVNGLFETLAVLEAAKKPISVVSSLAASAAYGIASVAGPIEAVTPASEFGSIGVAVSLFLDDQVVDIASTNAPNKRPDVATDEGKKVVREELDALHDVFVDAIARGRAHSTGRKITPDTVNTEFGRGGMFVASQAKKRGMIDKTSAKVVRTRSGARAEAEDNEAPAVPEKNAQEIVPMNAEQLKAQHPELYNSLLTEGEKQGEAKERKRVLAHLKLGKSSGAMAIAEKAIASGVSSMDEEIFAEYQSASMDRRDVAARQEDAGTASEALDGAKKKPNGGSDGAPAAGATDLVDLFASDLPPAKA